MLKLHCARCDRLIKEINLTEAKKLEGDEICMECKNFTKNVLDDIEREHKKIMGEYGNLHNKSVLKLEELMRKVFND